MSSEITHWPGPLVQQTRQPLQGEIVFSERKTDVVSAPPSLAPFKKLSVILFVLPVFPFGLPFITTIFILFTPFTSPDKYQITDLRSPYMIKWQIRPIDS
jgi:hypothetical protein